jgi:hypothetical protein
MPNQQLSMQRSQVHQHDGVSLRGSGKSLLGPKLPRLTSPGTKTKRPSMAAKQFLYGAQAMDSIIYSHGVSLLSTTDQGEILKRKAMLYDHASDRFLSNVQDPTISRDFISTAGLPPKRLKVAFPHCQNNLSSDEILNRIQVLHGYECQFLVQKNITLLLTDMQGYPNRTKSYDGPVL